MIFNKELLLSSSRKSWKMSSTHGTRFDKSYEKKHKEVWNDVWKRDNNSCYYCDFKANDFQEIHHLNDDHDDNTKDNLVTICSLCHACFHLDTASNTNGGKIVWLPEFSQQELNYLSRAIFVAIEESDRAEAEGKDVLGFVKIARMLESTLMDRYLVVEQRFQNGASDPAVFANALINMPEQQYENRGEFLKNFKLLSLRSRFAVQTKYWKDKVFKELPVETWEKLIVQKP